MADVIAAGSVRIDGDATGLDSAVAGAGRSLDSLAQKGAQAGKAASAGMKEAAAGAAVAEQSTASLTNKQAQFLASLERQSVRLASTTSEYQAWRAAQLGVTVQAEAHIAKIRATEAALGSQAGALNKAGMSAAAYNAALRGTPAQLTDIIVSLQGGQAPLTVFLQQGGQLRDMFGGAVPAAKALGSAVLGMVNPLTVGAGALALLAYAYNEGAKEDQRFRNSLILTGNIAGVTSDRLNEMAKTIGSQVGTRSQAADALAQLVDAGLQGSASLEKMGYAAVAMSKATGKGVSDTVAEFSRLAKEPTQASVELNQKYNYLTASVYEQIKALEEQGRVTEAANLAQTTFADTIDQRAAGVVANLGSIERAWIGIKGAIVGAWNAAKDIGRSETAEEELARIQGKLSARSRSGIGIDFGVNPETAGLGLERPNDELALQARRLRNVIQMQDELAKNWQEIGNRTTASITWDKEADKYLSGAAKIKKEHDDRVARIKALAGEAQVSQKDLNDRLAAETKRFNREMETENKRGAGGANRINKADLSSDIADIQARYQALLSTSANAERVLEAQRAAGLVMEGDYYAKKREFIRSDADLQVQALQEENKRIQAQKATGADQINNDKKVAQNKAQMASIQAKASTDIVISNMQEQASLKKLQNAYQDARDAAQQYLATTSDRYMRELRGMGMGGQWRDQNAARDQINDRYQLQREQLQGDVRRNQITREQYDVYLGVVNDANQQALDLDRGYWQDKLALQGDWTVGAREAFANYADSAANVARMTEDLFGNAFQGMEDALVEFATTGKLSFSDMANSIIADLIRIQVRQALMNSIGGASGWLAGMFGGASTGQGIAGATATDVGNAGGSLSYLANGGVFNSPDLSKYSSQVHDTPQFFKFATGGGVFGEAGPEAIMPLKRGPNGRLGVAAMMGGNGGGGGGGGLTVNIHKGADEDGVQESTSSDGKRQLDIYIRRAVRSTVDMEMAKPSGGVFGRFNENRYGMKKVV